MSSENLQYLLDRYFDEGLSPEETADLQHAVSASEKAAATFWEDARWHALLRQWALKTIPDQLPDRGKEVA